MESRRGGLQLEHIFCVSVGNLFQLVFVVQQHCQVGLEL